MYSHAAKFHKIYQWKILFIKLISTIGNTLDKKKYMYILFPISPRKDLKANVWRVFPFCVGYVPEYAMMFLFQSTFVCSTSELMKSALGTVLRLVEIVALRIRKVFKFFI